MSRDWVCVDCPAAALACGQTRPFPGFGNGVILSIAARLVSTPTARRTRSLRNTRPPPHRLFAKVQRPHVVVGAAVLHLVVVLVTLLGVTGI